MRGSENSLSVVKNPQEHPCPRPPGPPGGQVFTRWWGRRREAALFLSSRNNVPDALRAASV